MGSNVASSLLHTLQQMLCTLQLPLGKFVMQSWYVACQRQQLGSWKHLAAARHSGAAASGGGAASSCRSCLAASEFEASAIAASHASKGTAAASGSPIQLGRRPCEPGSLAVSPPGTPAISTRHRDMPAMGALQPAVQNTRTANAGVRCDASNQGSRKWFWAQSVLEPVADPIT